MAKKVGMPADRFYLKDKVFFDSPKSPPWEFYFQVKGDIERPRQILVQVDRCLSSEITLYNLEWPSNHGR